MINRQILGRLGALLAPTELSASPRQEQNSVDACSSCGAGSPLHLLPSAQSSVIVALQGGRGLVSRLAALGFVPGAAIEMVQNYGGGPLIVRVHGAQVALGRGEAARVLIQPEPVS